MIRSNHGRGAAVIPDVVGPYDRDRPCHTDAQAIGLGAIDAALLVELKFLEPRLEVFPSLGAYLAAAAGGLFQFGAEEYVALRHVAAIGGKCAPRACKRIGRGISGESAMVPSARGSSADAVRACRRASSP